MSVFFPSDTEQLFELVPNVEYDIVNFSDVHCIPVWDILKLVAKHSMKIF
jgi:hypothetical protein